MKSTKVRVTIVEDNTSIREVFRILISSSPKYDVVAVYEDAETAIQYVEIDKPNIILMDIDLPGMNGIDACLKIKQEFSDVDIVIITISENSVRVYEALCAGATGYLTKHTNQTDLLSSLDEICAGGAPMSANIARMVVHSFHKNTKSPLTERETEVLAKLSDGKSYKSISELLGISLATVKFHIKNVYIKLQVCNREDAINYAKKERYI
jgi:DNA-binding NarL/FixJ family response regulator